MFLVIIKDIRPMKELLIGVGTFTNTSSLFDTTQGLQFVTMNELKLVTAIFYYFLILPLNDSPLKTIKKCFFISSKKFFLFSRYSIFCNFSSSFPQF